MDKTTRIRELNDAFRKSFVGGKVFVTEGVNGLSDGDKLALLAKVRGFDDFHRDSLLASRLRRRYHCRFRGCVFPFRSRKHCKQR